LKFSVEGESDSFNGQVYWRKQRKKVAWNAYNKFTNKPQTIIYWKFILFIKSKAQVTYASGKGQDSLDFVATAGTAEEFYRRTGRRFFQLALIKKSRKQRSMYVYVGVERFSKCCFNNKANITLATWESVNNSM